MASDDLRARLAAAFREAGKLCDDECPDEAACDAAHPIQATVLHFDQVTHVEGPVEALADVAVAVVNPVALLRWAAEQLANIPHHGATALQGPYWHGQGWDDAVWHLHFIADHYEPTPTAEEKTAQQQLSEARAALQAVREAQSLGEALAAVAKHDGLTTDRPWLTNPPEPCSPVRCDPCHLCKTTTEETDRG